VIRIFSDLHWGHKASRVKELDALESLVSGADTVIFNGDTVEQKFEDSPAHLDHPLPPIGRLKDKIESLDSKAIFLTGNHDPEVSQAHYCAIDNGSVLITHGDAIFDAIAPWSANAGILKKLVEQGLEKYHADGSTPFYDYLQVFKEASIKEHAILKDYDPTVWGKIEVFARQAWPPNRPLKILECWKNAPKKAIGLMTQFGMSPDFLIIGHTHKPDISVIGGTTVINTGAFLPWPGATAVDIDSTGITVRKVLHRKGEFSLGETVKRFKKEIDLQSLETPVPENDKIPSRADSQVSA